MSNHLFIFKLCRSLSDGMSLWFQFRLFSAFADEKTFQFNCVFFCFLVSDVENEKAWRIRNSNIYNVNSNWYFWINNKQQKLIDLIKFRDMWKFFKFFICNKMHFNSKNHLNLCNKIQQFSGKALNLFQVFKSKYLFLDFFQSFDAL